MSNVLVTGGCGFIGSNLVDMLIEQGNSVTVVDNLVTGNKNNCNDKAKYIFKDYRDVLKNNELYDFSNIDIIFHLAAMPRIQPSFDDPLYTFNNNASGTATLCQFAKENNCKIVYAGSSSYYGGVYLNPYSFSKWIGEEICMMYSKIYGISTCIARFFNVYGPRHLSEGPYSTVVAIFENQYKQQKPLTITGNGEQRRDFTHVSDICSGLIAMSKDHYEGKVFNLGTGKNYSINELADLFVDSKKQYIPKRPGEAWITLADTKEMRQLTGWQCKHTLAGYIQKFIEKEV